MNSENIYPLLYSTGPDLIYTYLPQNWKQAIYPLRFVFLLTSLDPVMYSKQKTEKIIWQMADKQPTKGKEICCL